MKELRKLFFNPPKGGNEVGVPTASSMSPLPGPLGTQTCPIGAYDGGKSIEAQRYERETMRMTPEQRYDRMEQQFAENQRRRANPSGPGAQTSLRESFERGEMAARNNAVQSGKVGQTEFRNYDRGFVSPNSTNDPGDPRMQVYDFESEQEGEPHGRIGQPNPAPPSYVAARPALRPDTSMPYRTDGKPNYTMGVKPSGNSPNFTSDMDNDADDIDANGGI